MAAEPDMGETATTSGRAHRRGTPNWLAAVGGLLFLLLTWLVFRAQPQDDLQADSIAEAEETPEQVEIAPRREPATTVGPPQPETSSTVLQRIEPSGPADSEVVSVQDLGVGGWRLLVGDGHSIEAFDLTTGERRRHVGVGAPIEVIDGRVLTYRNSELSWLDLDDLGAEREPIIGVPTLQQMFTRGRSADRPMVVDDGDAMWWPNNNASPQTWVKLRLRDGSVLDNMALTDGVFGGPEIVATVGSGSFERREGRWEPLGDLFASAASPDAVVGQQCQQPDVCYWVLLDRATGVIEQLTEPVGGPFDVSLVADAERPLLVTSEGITDLSTDRFIPLVRSNPQTLVAVNRAEVLAVAGGGVILDSAVVTIYNLDPEVGTATEIEIVDLVPRWLVLVPPSA